MRRCCVWLLSRMQAFGLHKPSQVMVDKAVTVAREKIGASFGQLDADTMRGVERRLAVFLGVAK